MNKPAPLVVPKPWRPAAHLRQLLLERQQLCICLASCLVGAQQASAGVVALRAGSLQRLLQPRRLLVLAAQKALQLQARR